MFRCDPISYPPDPCCPLILGTSLDRDVKRLDYLGTKGDTADIVRSFRFL